MRIFKIILFILFFTGTIPIINYCWFSKVGSSKIRTVNNEEIKNRIVLVFGAGREYRNGKQPNYFFNGRVQAVVALRHHYPQCKIIISGYSDGKNYDEANDMKAELIARGIKDTLLFLDHSSNNTYQSLQYYNRHFLYEPVVVVSQKAHLCRILWIAQQMNIDAVGIEATGWPKREPYWFLFREIIARLKATFKIYLKL